MSRNVVAFDTSSSGGPSNVMGRDVLAHARARLRVVFDNGIRLGPGKIDLLEAIAATGSITAGAKTMGMSYRRAWVLIDEVNRLFRRPVIVTASGGAGGGGADLTDFGRALVAAFRRIEARTLEAVHSELAPFADDIAAPEIDPDDLP